MIIRMHYYFISQNFTGSIGNNFIYIHMYSCAGSALKTRKRELVSIFSTNNFITSFCNRIFNIIVNIASLEIRKSGSLFNLNHSHYKFHFYSMGGKREVFQSFFGLCTIVFLHSVYVTPSMEIGKMKKRVYYISMNTGSLENPNISFRKNTRKETGVRVVSETPITKGSFGKIFDTV